MSNLAQLIAAVGPELAAHAHPRPGEGRFDSLAPQGDPSGETPRGDTRAFVLEAVYEGYLLHYREPRAFVGMDPDLRLLAGDTLYAHGLARLADAGDMEAVAELADLISLCAWAEAAGRRDLVDRLWDASSRRLLGAHGDGARADVAADLARPRP